MSSELPTHGGSLRVWLHRAGEPGAREGRPRRRCASAERAAGLDSIATLRRLRAEGARRLRRADRVPASTPAATASKTVAYGAAGQGQHAAQRLRRRRASYIAFAVDASPHKQGRYPPGSHLQIRPPEADGREHAPTTCSSCPGTCSDEMHGAARLHPRLGRPLRPADPAPAGAAVKFIAHAHPRRDRRSRRSRRPTSAAASPCTYDEATLPRPRPRARRHPMQHLRQCEARHACAACTIRRRRPRRPSWCACVRGRLFDVAVDLRPDSPAFRQWLGVELDADDGQALYIPAAAPTAS